MNRSVLARIGPALFAFYVLAYAAFFAWAWLSFSNETYLPIYRTEEAARRALLLLLDWVIPLTAAAVVTALSLAAGSKGRGSPALPFNQLVASAVLTFLALAAAFTALSETAGAGSRRRLEEMAWQTRLAARYKELAGELRTGADWARAAEYERLYLRIVPDDDVVEKLLNIDEANAAKARTGRPAASAAAGAASRPQAAVDTGSLVRKAQDYYDRGDWFSALWFARLAAETDPKRADATRLAGLALEKIEEPRPEDESAEDRLFFRTKQAAFDVLVKGDPVTAYYAFSDLARRRPGDRDASEFLELAEEKLEGMAYYADEADITAALPGIERILWFNRRDATTREVVWAGRMVTVSREEKPDDYWFFDVEAIRYDTTGDVAWHLSAPRAKLSDDGKTLLLRGVDRTDAKKGTRAAYHAGSRPAAERDILVLGIGIETVPIHSLDRAPLAGIGLAELWSLRRSLSYGDRLHTEASVELATRAAMPFAFLVVSLFAVAFGWSLRGRWTGRAPALAWIAAPLIVAAVGMLVKLYLYAHRIVLAFAVLALGGLKAAGIAFGVLELGLVAVALAALAGQSAA